ncbi:DUF6538 domain-containing protein [Thioclava sp. F42-5]|uniref:DUF6538 domain-containing protein n=1 Tax=Thioclava sp. F42-5 TaxID=1973005 RepID=UPI0011BADCFE|nr:DUF6538 domain-containing protein [Thioclava sp. F42-5]
MITSENICIAGIERRGRVYYMRFRVPARFAEVETRREINVTLGTRDYEEARARFALKKRAIFKQWEVRLSQNGPCMTPDAYDAAMSLLDDLGLSYKSMDEILAGPVNDLLVRIEKAATQGLSSASLPAALGAMEFPRTLLSEMPPIIEELKSADIAAKNPRQLRAWRNKYLQAASSFAEIVSDKPVLDLTEPDAVAYRRHWKERRDQGDVTTAYANKKLRFVRQLVDAYHERFDVPPSQRSNPFEGFSIEKLAGETSEENRKLAFPVPWIQQHLIEQKGLEGLNAEARDISTISAECGSRQAEVFDLPPGDIFLNHAIPHIKLRVVDDPEFKRQLKNGASVRPVVLLGAALDAMRRHPQGFPRYRGKDAYSGAVNSYFRENELFPPIPEGESGKYTISCTRHTFEDRMRFAKMTNEERAYLMGHSVGRVRGRPVYGSGPDLQMRALYQEMVSFPTKTWEPRPIQVLRHEIDRLASDLGFRVE